MTRDRRAPIDSPQNVHIPVAGNASRGKKKENKAAKKRRKRREEKTKEEKKTDDEATNGNATTMSER